MVNVPLRTHSLRTDDFPLNRVEILDKSAKSLFEIYVILSLSELEFIAQHKLSFDKLKMT